MCWDGLFITTTGESLFSVLQKKYSFRYHVLGESNSRPSSTYILSLLVPQIAPVIAKHALYCTLSSSDSKLP